MTLAGGRSPAYTDVGAAGDPVCGTIGGARSGSALVRLRTLVAPSLLPGTQHLQWDGRDEGGEGVVPGVYFYRLLTPDGERRGKLVKSSVVAR